MGDSHDAQLWQEAEGAVKRGGVLFTWRGLVLAFAVIWTSLALISAPAVGHEQHRRERAAAAAAAAAAEQQSANVLQAAPAGQAGGNTMTPSAGMMPSPSMEGMPRMSMEPEDRSKMSVLQRTLLWLGAFHPMIIHFPIAFFPAALFTAVVGRRRPAFGAPVQFLVVAGGIVAPIAALLGWFNAGFNLVDHDKLLLVHRWLGTAMGIGGLALAVWAWRRPWEDRGAGMILSLSAMTIAIAVQGWFGASLVYGMEHMNW